VRIATWNVNSLKARLDKVTWWLERARPDVLLMQETRIASRRAR
jgi:exodeoxyribonuclease-3